MAKNGFKVLDSDMHVLEPADLWQRYIDPAFQAVAPQGLTRWPRDESVSVNGIVCGRPYAGPATRRAKAAERSQKDAIYAFAEARGWDATAQIEAMDMEGIDVTVLFPTRGLFVLGIDSRASAGIYGIDGDFAAAIARAYNEWLADFCRPYPGRLYGAAMVAPHDVASAVAETRRCVEQHGFKSIFLLPGCVNKRPWHDRAYDPLWAECQALDVPVVFHGGGRDYLTPDFGLEVFDQVMMFHTFSHPLGPMSALVSMAAGGVFERFPALRAGYLEANCSWAPWLLWRLDEHFEWRGHLENPELKMRPSEYFRRNAFLSVETDEAPVQYFVAAYGDDNIVFSTDFPHADAKFPRSTENLLKLPVSEETKRKVLWDNCLRLYKLPDLETPASPTPVEAGRPA